MNSLNVFCFRNESKCESELGVKFKVAFAAAASSSNDESVTTTPTNQVLKSMITSRNGYGHVQFNDLVDEETSSSSTTVVNEPTTTTTTSTVQISVTNSSDQSVNDVFESIFKNENDFQSFLDVLEKKEFSRPENVTFGGLIEF